MLDKLKVLQDLQKIVPKVYNKLESEISLGLDAWNNLDLDKTTHAVAAKSVPYTILATDGSQIYPDRHQGLSCFLINIGRAQLNYGVTASSVILDSQPFLISQETFDNFISSSVVDAFRNDYELKLGFDYAQASGHVDLFLVDGTIIFNHLEQLESDIKNRFLSSALAILDQFYQNKILISGYISSPKSKEVINILKQKSEKPLNFQFLTDADLFAQILKPGQYSAIFSSKAQITQNYRAESIPHFVYFNTGQEIARIEFPYWVAQAHKIEFILSIIFDQIQKGQGYPVALSEAHEQAVVKSADRQFFYEMLQSLTQENNKIYLSSQKSIKKRVVGV